MEKPRKQTYTLAMYLEKMKDQDIRSDQDMQRLSDQWNKNMVNELIATVLNDGYIPPIILGQEANVDKYARKIREILKKDFFIECTDYTKGERKNGTLERIIMESVMCMFHLDNWKRTNQVGAYMNKNSSMKKFEILDSELNRLENIITNDLYPLFTSKDSFLLFTLFHKFTRLDLNDDGKFADCLYAFKDGLLLWKK